MPEDEAVTFATLGNVLERTSKAIPFENLCIIANKTGEITRENLLNKMLVKNEGGLCYELNSILYFFLLENDFDAALTRGIVYKQATQEYQSIGRTHVTILLIHEGRTYLVDTGFGGNLPLKPVPLTGETVTSSNGEFRVKEENSVHGDYVLEMKLKYKDTEWRIGYAFDSTKLISDVTEFHEIQTIIGEHPDSPFNKSPLATKLTESGNVTLTNTSFTKWEDGVVSKEVIDEERYRELLREWFGL
ncbi:MAG: putative arylamine N-acetyltransferase [Brevibacillus sp.]|jgi:N-hydroxyarylamine O-acetyltransferase|nr:putative arylamine N-acetyltransferase [Brevibacillus sp.]